MICLKQCNTSMLWKQSSRNSYPKVYKIWLDIHPWYIHRGKCLKCVFSQRWWTFLRAIKSFEASEGEISNVFFLYCSCLCLAKYFPSLTLDENVIFASFIKGRPDSPKRMMFWIFFKGGYANVDVLPKIRHSCKSSWKRLKWQKTVRC